MKRLDLFHQPLPVEAAMPALGTNVLIAADGDAFVHYRRVVDGIGYSLYFLHIRRVFLILFSVIFLLFFVAPTLATESSPIIGADLVAYTPPTGSACTINVPSQYLTIQAAIDAASNGDTVCVGSGTYNESLVIGKSIRLSGRGAANTVINGQSPTAVFFAENSWTNATLEGFKIVGAGTQYYNASVWLSGAWGGATPHANIRYNHIISGNNGMALFVAGTENTLVEHNIFEGRDSQKSIVVIGSDAQNQQVLHNTFTGTAVLAPGVSDSGSIMGFGGRSGAVKYNAFNTQGTPEIILGVAYTPNDVNYNNFNSPAQRKLGLSGGNTVPLNAENNWYGTPSPTAGEYGVNDINGFIDYTPFATSPFPEYPIPPLNQPPTIDAGASASGVEGGLIALDATAADPDGDPLTYAWSYTPGADVDPGAACTFTSPAAEDTGVTCTDDGSYIATVTVDDHVNPPVQDQTTVTITNATPVVAAAFPSAALTCSANTGSVQVTFTDAGGNDTHRAVVNWGDGGTEDLGAVTSPFAAAHAFGHAGAYAAAVTITDDDGGTGAATTPPVVMVFTVVDGGVAPPINQNGTSVFNAKSTIPVKVTIQDCDGSFPSGLAPTIKLTVISTATPPYDINEPVSTSAADAGGVMRFDASAQQYIYYLSAKALPDPTATYRITITVPATGQSVTAVFGVKQ